MRVATVDIGNTYTKVGFFNKNDLVEVIVTTNVDKLENKIKRFAPQHVAISDVGNRNISWLQSLHNETRVLHLNKRTGLPITIQYDSKTLGQDRIALAVAGYSEFKNYNTLVIAAGTCITYNFISHQGVFTGGAISPGLHMRLKAMHHFTARLPGVKIIDYDVALTGTSTKASMTSGALNGAAFEMDGFINAYKQQHKNLKVILTGGDLERFESRLKNKIFARPHAVLHGLHAILQHNFGAI
jgi:type III pantothenate kinase